MLAQRLATAAVGIPIVLAVVLIGGHLFTGVAAVILFLGALEFAHTMMRQERPLWRPNLTALAGATGAASLPVIVDAGVTWLPELAIAVGIVMLYVLARGPPRFVLPWWAVIAAAVAYVGLLGSYLVLLRGLDDGDLWLLWAVLSTWGADTCAYAVGRAVGRHKMAPAISPGKTWEGTVGGLAGGLVVVVALGLALDLGVTAGQAVMLGLMLPGVAVLGDLGESRLKRGAGVKDTSTLVPGHGGFLDRLDSLLFTVPLVYYFAEWVVLK